MMKLRSIILLLILSFSVHQTSLSNPFNSLSKSTLIVTAQVALLFTAGLVLNHYLQHDDGVDKSIENTYSCYVGDWVKMLCYKLPQLPWSNEARYMCYK